MTEQKRVGSKSIKDIPPHIREQLNHGEIETANLVEFLSIDGKVLVQTVLEQFQRCQYLPQIITRINNLEVKTHTTVHGVITSELAQQITLHQDWELKQKISTHPADIVRCWGAVIVALDLRNNIQTTLTQMWPFAEDRHFNVREVAWSVLRSRIIEHLDEAISILSVWAIHDHENIRRFASEATRPRGVCVTHIKELKNNPEKALSILEPLKADLSPYVQTSVGNWLNDASKSRPDFVLHLCSQWEKESNTRATKLIIKKALRTLHK